jgi:hypothetical protein
MLNLKIRRMKSQINCGGIRPQEHGTCQLEEKDKLAAYPEHGDT